MMPIINTHTIVKNLITTGFTESQAEAITSAILSGQHDVEDLVTKEQFSTIEKEWPSIKSELSAIKQIMQGMATKVDLSNMATKADLSNMATKADLSNMATKVDIKDMATKADLQNMIKDLKIDMLKWILPLMLTVIGLMIGLMGLIATVILK